MIRKDKPQLDSVKKELLFHMKNHIVGTISARREVVFLSNYHKIIEIIGIKHKRALVLNLKILNSEWFFYHVIQFRNEFSVAKLLYIET